MVDRLGDRGMLILSLSPILIFIIVGFFVIVVRPALIAPTQTPQSTTAIPTATVTLTATLTETPTATFTLTPTVTPSETPVGTSAQ